VIWLSSRKIVWFHHENPSEFVFQCFCVTMFRIYLNMMMFDKIKANTFLAWMCKSCICCFLCNNAMITIIPASCYLFSLPMLRPTCSANSSLATLETTRQQREPLRAQFSFEKRSFHTQFIANWVRLKVSQQYDRWFTHSDVAHFHYIDPYVNNSLIELNKQHIFQR